MFLASLGLYTLTKSKVNPSVDHSQVKESEPTEVTQVQKPLTLNDYSSVINKERGSVVKITGYSCGYDFSGSGFVVAPDLVATNAHAIAGISTPQVSDSNGNHEATTVLLDPKLDFAVLRVSGLAGKPLALNQSSSNAVDWVGSHNGDHDVLLGYPDGGSFKAVLAVITDEYDADISDIYGKSSGSRDIYTISADVVDGDSGGPLVQQNGQVAGIVFGVPDTGKDSGFVLPTTDFYSEIQHAKQLYEPVSNQACADLSGF